MRRASTQPCDEAEQILVCGRWHEIGMLGWWQSSKLDTHKRGVSEMRVGFDDGGWERRWAL